MPFHLTSNLSLSNSKRVGPQKLTRERGICTSIFSFKLKIEQVNLQTEVVGFKAVMKTDFSMMKTNFLIIKTDLSIMKTNLLICKNCILVR